MKVLLLTRNSREDPVAENMETNPLLRLHDLCTGSPPDGLAIVMKADHFCIHWRGVKDDETEMTTSVMRGAFLKEPSLRLEFLSLMKK